MRNHYSAFAIVHLIPFTIANVFAFTTAHAASTPPTEKVALKTPVEISFIEALDPKDTTSSRRFQEEYEAAIATGVKLTAARVASCGYRLATKTAFYGASDPMMATEQGEDAAAHGAWLIVGPRRSNHYTLLAKGAPNTPSVSLMASSDSLRELGPLHASLSPSNTQMASAAADEARRRSPRSRTKNYVTFLASDCMNCRDFAAAFDRAAVNSHAPDSLHLTKSAEVAITGDAPDVAPLRDAIRHHTPAFVLLPNYSIVTSHVVSALAPEFPDVFFVGGDGWGDSQFGFVQNGKDITRAVGFSVRGNPPVLEGLKGFLTGRALIAASSREPSSELAHKFGSSSSLAILRVFDSVATMLCESRPANQKQFVRAFSKSSPRHFAQSRAVSIYEIKAGKIVYAKSVKSVLSTPVPQ